MAASKTGIKETIILGEAAAKALNFLTMLERMKQDNPVLTEDEVADYILLKEHARIGTIWQQFIERLKTEEAKEAR